MLNLLKLYDVMAHFIVKEQLNGILC